MRRVGKPESVHTLIYDTFRSGPGAVPPFRTAGSRTGTAGGDALSPTGPCIRRR